MAASASLSRATAVIKVNGRNASALLNSGSTNSFIYQFLFAKLHLDISPSFGKVTGSYSMPILGHCFVTLILDNVECKQVQSCSHFKVSDNSVSSLLIFRQNIALEEGIVEKSSSPCRVQVVIAVLKITRSDLLLIFVFYKLLHIVGCLSITSNGGFVRNGFEVPCLQYLLLCIWFVSSVYGYI